MATVFKRGGKANRSGYFYAQWFDHLGKRRTKCTNTSDKAAAERIAKKYETDAALRREGVIDAAAESVSEQSRLSIEEHLVDYQAKLETAARSEQYVRETIGYIRAISDASRFEIVADIRTEGGQRFAQALKEKELSARTIQAHLRAMKGFTKWLAAHEKLPRDPLVSIKLPNPKTDRRLERRVLLTDEWVWLEDATLHAPDNFGMSGMARSILYATGIQTGLRSGELRSLTRGKICLDAEKPYIRCKAKATKNRKDARQYIDHSLAKQLRIYLADRPSGSPVFDLPDETDMAQMLREDLARARSAWLAKVEQDPEELRRRAESDFLLVKNEEGETLDFHSLRHTCGAWLAMTGAHPKVVQTVMRHSTITLTMDTYGHLFPSTESDAVDRSGEMMRRPDAAPAEPVDNCPKPRSTTRSSQDAQGSETNRRCATHCDSDGKFDDPRSERNGLKTRARCDVVRSRTMQCLPLAPLAQLAEQLTLNQ